VAEVNKVVAKTNSKDAYITLSELAAENGATSGLRANDEFEPTGFENDQIVLFTYANNEIQSVKAAESAEGTLTRKVSGKKACSLLRAEFVCLWRTNSTLAA